MCYCVYIATAAAQETSTFIPDLTDLYLEEPIKKELQNLRYKFTNPHIYYVGSYTNCSCGFDIIPDQLNNPDRISAKRSVEKLLGLIKLESQKGGVELYCCWSGNTASDVEEYVQQTANSISLDNYFGLIENQFITFKP